MFKIPLFSKQQKDGTKFLTLSINSDYMRCLALYKENGTTKIIGSGKQEVDPGKIRSGSIIYKDQVSQAINRAVKKACSELGEDINNAIVGVSGDLCLGLMTTIRAKRSKPSPINNKEIENIYKKIDETAYLQAQNEYMQINGSSENDLETVTKSDVYLKIDGQKVSELEGREGASIEVASFNAFVPSHHIKTLTDTIKGAGLQIMAIGSEMYCIVQTLVSAHEENDFVLVEIDGDYTNVAVVFGKGIVTTRTLNVGYKHFVEGVSERMGLTMREAEKMLKSYVQGKLTPSEAQVVKNSVRTPIEIWLSGLELLFAEYSGVKTFSPKIYFTGESTDISDLWDMLTQEGWTKSIPFKAPPEFKKVNFLDINQVTDSTGKITSSEWIPCSCLTVIRTEMDDK